MNQWLKCFLGIGLLGLLTACGFHLRQPQSLPPQLQVIYLNTSTPNDPFIQTLSRVLVANNVSFADQKQAQSILNIISIQTTDSMNTGGGVSVSGSYTAYLSVVFSVTDQAGKVLIPPTTVKESQDFTSNATQVLSGSSTVNQLASQMRQALAQNIMNQLAKAPVSASSPAPAFPLSGS